MATTTRLYTGEDLWRMPGDEPWEIWEGELRKVPGAGAEANGLAGDIYTLIKPFVRAGNLGMLTTADETYYLRRNPDTLVVPDVAFVAWKRLPDRSRPKGYMPAPPDLAIEVVSPSDGPSDVAAKMERYRQAGVPLIWLVYPNRRAVVVFRDGIEAGEFEAGGVLAGEPVLTGFRLPVADIFADLGE